MLKNTYFQFNDKIYKQIKGLPMGSNISPILAITYMHYIEQSALNKFQNYLTYVRYVDDCLIILKNKKEAEECLKVFNSINKNIQFEIELPDTNLSLNILDTNITIDNNEVTYKIYKKSARKDIFVNYNTSLPKQTLKNICTNELNRRLSKYRDTDDLSEPILNFKNLLRKNDYPEKFITRILQDNHKRKKRNKVINNEFFYLDIPFINDSFNNIIKRIYEKDNIHVRIYHKQKSLRGILNRNTNKNNCNIKDCLIRDENICFVKNCVYKINCSCGDFYIGSTARDLHIRIKEHLYKNTSLTNHLKICKKTREDIEVKVLSRHKDIINARINEAMMIHRTNPKINNKHELIDYKNILGY